MNTPVSFALAKLLKGKGFEMTAGSCYFNGEFFINQNVIPLQYPELKGEGYKEKVTDKIVFAPTIADVVMWLYEKHGIWIHAMMSFKEFTPYIQCDWNYKKDAIKGVLEVMGERFNSPTEAYEAAIEYTLINLI